MRINRVALKNYRSHIETEVEFDKGINLILGPNGAGKSSIIEAIGIALFDADARSSRSDAVRQGEKSATIEVFFEANDGLDYVVEKRLGATSWSKLYRQGDGASRVEGKDAVLAKVRQLSGLERNEKNLFQNVITAYQNKFVSIFTETPARREELFNQIFDTAIYREMFDGYAKEATDSYRQERDIVSSARERLEFKRKDVSSLRNQAKDNKRLVLQCTASIDAVEKELKESGAALDSLEQIRISAESTKAALAHKRELLATRREEEKKGILHVEECENARKKMGMHQNGYEKYCQISGRVNELGGKIEKLEQIEKSVNECRETLNALSAEKSGLLVKEENVSKAVEQTRIEEKEVTSGIAEGEKEKSTLAVKLEEIKQAGTLRAKQLQELQQHHQSYEKQSTALAQLCERIESYSAAGEAITRLEQSIEEVNRLRTGYNEELKKRSRLQQSQALVKSRIEENRKAKQTLGKKNCPILQEPCKNVSEKESIDDYFLQREKQFSDELSKIVAELSSFDDLDEKISRNEASSGRLAHQLEEEKENRRQKEILTKEKSLMEKDLELVSVRQQALISSLPENIRGEYEKTGDQSHLLSMLNEGVMELRADYSQQKTLLDNVEKELRKLDESRGRLSDSLIELGTGLEQIRKRLGKIDQKMQTGQELIEKNRPELEQLPALRETRRNHETELASFKNDYDTFLAFGQKAKELDGARAHVRHIQTEIDRLQKEEKQLQAGYEELMGKWDEERYQELKNRIGENEQQRSRLNRQLSEAKTALALSKRDLHDALGTEREIRELSRKAAVLERKVVLSQRFRANLSGMGKFVASRLMHRIEVLATEHFRSITGRPEAIRWVNDEKDAYAVYLYAYKSALPRPFEILSGGEQVAVALALRSAMAGLLTSANIALFDEPTINLDMERKTALAESLQGMLQNLEQAIIVTHDDVFREMAQKTITI